MEDKVRTAYIHEGRKQRAYQSGGEAFQKLGLSAGRHRNLIMKQKTLRKKESDKNTGLKIYLDFFLQ